MPSPDTGTGVRRGRATPVLAVVVALLVLCGEASAAPGRHRGDKAPRPRHHARERVATSITEAPPKAIAVAAADAVEAAAEPPAAPDEAPVAPTPAPSVPAMAPSIEPPAVVVPYDFERNLGRREAARLAAGRIEVAIAAGVDLARRDFTFRDAIGTAPRPYRLAAAPLASVAIEVYPLASSGLAVVRDLGLQGHFSRAFAVASATSAGAGLATSWTRFGGDLRQRLLMGAAHQLEVGGTIGIDASYFDLRADNGVGALIPSSRMVSLRFGLDARVRVTSRVSLLAGGGYLMTIAHGEIYDQFRDPSVAGLDGFAGASFRLAPGVELCAQGRYTRYFARFRPEVGDPSVAGGALDQQFQLGMGLRYAH